MKSTFALILYYGFAYWLPDSYLPYIGPLCNKIRILCVKGIFKHCGKIRTINRGVLFHNGSNVSIGDNSGIGANCDIPDDIQIGANVMISRNVFISIVIIDMTI
ncbi:MAG: hypothetical protein J5965_28200 [Aeriscardovia sp.]|nr:hypothetical protein [Aeriscardovia sp.]